MMMPRMRGKSFPAELNAAADRSRQFTRYIFGTPHVDAVEAKVGIGKLTTVIGANGFIQLEDQGAFTLRRS